MTVRERSRRVLGHPTRLVPLAYLAVIAVGTALLMLPFARPHGQRSSFVAAVFTATSALSTSGLVIEQTSTYWSTPGHVVLTVLTQLGGLGVMTMAMLLLLLVSRQLGLRNRLVLEAEGAGFGLADARRMVVRIALISLVVEAAVAAITATRLWGHYGYPPGRAAWYGVFHAVQSFNNSGFSLYPDSIIRFATDGWICLPLTLAVIIGAAGFPVLFELGSRWRDPYRWSVHTRLTVIGSTVLLATGTLAFLGFEWSNPRTLGPLDLPSKLMASFVQATIPRSGGLNSVDIGALREESYALVNGLMFIGGGPASTAGGIKVTTFFLLAYVIWAELRGEPDVVIGRRRIAGATQRQAITIALIAIALIGVGALLLLEFSVNMPFYRALFEVTSALSTAGLSTGLSQALPDPSEVVLMVLMFVGRLGTILAVTSLALNTRQRQYRYPLERPLVG